MESRTEGVLSSSGSGTNSGFGEHDRKRRFGVFELDLRVGELRRNGTKVKLQEQPFQVLAQLLEKPGEVVTREDLRNHLWSADTFVDFDHSLNAAIRRLRDALGDSAENPTFVETVARRGYRFLAPVSSLPANGNGTSASHSSGPGITVVETVSPPRHRHIWWIGAFAAAIALVLVGIKVGLSLAKRHPAAQVQPRITQLTANPADDRVRAAAISRDGKYLAFSDKTGFYIRQIDTGETHPVTLPSGMVAGLVSWFPDSDHMIVAMSEPTRGSGLWEISALGGTPRKLSDEGRAPAISPDGTQVTYITGAPMHNEVWIMAADGEQPRKLMGQEGDFFGALAWSPDSTRIAFIRRRLAQDWGMSGAVECVQVKSQRVSRMIEFKTMGWFESVSGPLAWTPDGHLIYAQSEAPPRQLDSNLWEVALGPEGHPAGGPLRLTNDRGVVSGISISGDGKRVVYVKSAPQPDVYVAKLEGAAPLSEPVRLTLDDRQDLPFDWTPDGKSVLFISDRTGTFDIYRQAVDKAVPELLVGCDRPVLTPRLSPDGTQLLYLIYPSWSSKVAPVSLMRVPLAGGAPQRVLQEKWINNQQCARTPATLCLYGVVNDSKFQLVGFDPMKGKGKVVYERKDEVPQAYNWSLSPDGGMLAIAKGKDGGEEPQIRLVSLNGAPEKVLKIDGWPGVSSVDWAADGKSVWAASAGEEENALLNIDLEGHARAVWRPRKMRVYWAIPSRDGRYLALHVASASANAWMVERQ